MRLRLPAIALAFAAAGAFGQSQPAGLEALPEAPPPPDTIGSGEAIEPEVRIIQGARKVVTEYRINGQLRAIKIEPEGFPAYWLVDGDGDGTLERRLNDRDSRDFLIPQWVLFRW